ncbi:MAG: methylmalonyl-CoA mutase family protein [Chloroflexi bacterium]|nr:methylmalonyl-CoA mutase family protein [Chloroflexota bacterium]
MTTTGKSKQEWREQTYEPAVKRFAERQESFQNSSGAVIDAVYTPEDTEGIDYDRDIGYPGEYPYTRGVQPNMYRGRLWTMRQYAGFASAEESNKRYRYLLAQGQSGLSVAFDLPTQTGYDSDHEIAMVEVGKVGVPVCTLADMETLFDQIPLDKVTTSMTINASAPILLALYIAVAKKQGVAPDKLGGTIQNDILKEYIARGTYIFPVKPSLRLVTDLFKFCADQVPQWNTISISGYHMSEAGATAAQELAFTLANGIAYVNAALEAGLQIDDFGPRLSFFFVSQNNFFEEIAKFRAARRMWARIMRERFGAKSPRSWSLRFHTQTAGVSLTAQQVEINIVRTTVQALAAVLGGTQSLHTNSMDEALSLPTDKAVTIALRTQQILAAENGVADTVDPLAGSYYVESLTTKVEEQATEYLNTIDDMGGALVAIERGYIQRQIQESAYRYHQQVESGERTIVGVNKFTSDESAQPQILRIDPEAKRLQLKRLADVKRQRDAKEVQRRLQRVEAVARTDENIMPSLIDAVESNVTLGEICDTLRGVWGTYKETIVF